MLGKKYKIGYVCYESLHGNGILQAMVLTPMRLIKEAGHSVCILHCTRPNEINNLYFKNKENFRELDLEEMEFTRWSRSASDYLWAVFDQLLLLKYVYQIFRRSEVVHVRGYPLALIALSVSILTRKNFVFDPRGLFPEEAVFLKKLEQGSIKYTILKWIEKKVINYCSKIICINGPMQDYYVSICGPKIYKKCVIIPNCSNRKLELEHVPLPFDDRTLNLVYLGSAQSWHEIDYTLSIMKGISEQFDVNIFIITNDISEFRRKISNISFLCPVEIYSVDHKNLHVELEKMDFGFCLRSDDIISNVAFPVKFSDMLSAGVSVVYDAHIGNLDDFNKDGLHLSLDRTEISEAENLRIIYQHILNLTKQIRVKERIISEFNENLSWEVHIEKLNELYRGLVENSD